MARSLLAAALLAGAAFAKPLPRPNANPYAFLTARQEVTPSSSSSVSSQAAEASAAVEEAASSTTDSATPTITPLEQAAVVDGAAADDTEVTDADVATTTSDNFLTTHTPTSCEVKTSGGSLVYTPNPTVGPDGTLTGVATTATFPDRLMCVCDGSIQMDASSSRDPSGKTSYFCNALGAWSTSAASVAVPSGTPGDADNDAWSQISCDYGSLTSSLNNPLQQWNDSGAVAAYNDAKEAYHLDDKDASWSEFLVDFFHNRVAMNCDKIDEPNCDVTVNCGQDESPNAPVDSPAGYMITNSMVGLHSLYDRLWRGINGAQASVLGQVGTFVETLSPINQDITDQKDTKLLLDGVQIGLTALMAPFFHSVLIRTKWANDNEHFFGDVVDISYGTLGASMAFIKDSMESLSTLPVQNQISSYVSNTVTNWKYALGNGTMNMFNDQDALFKSIDAGIMFPSGDLDKNAMDVEGAMTKLIFASALPAVWASGSGVPLVTIIKSDGLPQDGTGCESFKLDEYEQTQREGWNGGLMVEGLSDIASSARICDDQGNAYWMVGVSTKEQTANCPAGTKRDLQLRSPQGVAPAANGVCTWKQINFESPYGIDALDGSKFGGLKREDIAFNAINSWARNGNANNWQTLDYDINNSDDFNALLSGDLAKLSGLVKMNVCSLQDVYDTVWDDPTNSKGTLNFPCPG